MSTASGVYRYSPLSGLDADVAGTTLSMSEAFGDAVA
jgi:hypothetical protein